MSFDMDAYREAFDIHGEEVECTQCGAVMDIYSVEHWVQTFNMHGEEEDAQPLCDRCYWDGRYAEEDEDHFYYD